MRFTAFCTAVLAVFTTSVAGLADLTKFKVKTKVIEGNTSFCGLWGSLYHTTASTWDIWFQNNETAAFPAFINDTSLQWVAGDIPWATDLENVYYSVWSPVEASAGYGANPYGKNFTVAENGTIVYVSTEVAWNGWLVCDWWHQVPQLFWIGYDPDIAIISTCARVELYAEVIASS